MSDGARLPAWKASPLGNRRYWTRGRVLEGLRRAAAEIAGPLPCRDATYSRLKKGRMDWPPASRVLEYFHSMARAWLAAGVEPSRVSLKNLDWTQAEVAFLLEQAGAMTLKAIARVLCRPYSAVRSKLGSNGLGLKARTNQGYLSAAEIAKEYRCPYHRVRDLLAAGTLRGRYDRCRNCWRVDPADIVPAVEAVLRVPKTRSYRSVPPDVGNYYERYGLKRTLRGGRLVVVSREERRELPPPAPQEKSDAATR
jgi:hypothetical protein